MDDEVVIKVDNVSKDFLLPHEKVSSIKGLFTGLAKGKSRKTKETQHALKDINFEIKKGEFFGIVGRNGSGKSTLLKILANIYQPTKGQVTTKGKLVPFIELGVGFNPELTGRENVYLNGAMLGFSEKEVSKMYKEIVEFAELERFMDQKLKNYSSGMQVRLAFSMATRSEADILLVDEVLAVGDADFQRKCFRYFRSLKKNKKTVVFVSHDMEAIREYCDRCVLINESRLLFEGKADIAAERYTRLFNQSQLGTSVAQSDGSERWGDKKAQFTNVDVAIDNDNLRIHNTIRFNADMLAPIFGVLIKNSTGTAVCGANNKIIKTKSKDQTKGDTVTLEWVIPNIFSSDDYAIDIAVTHQDGVTQADWWHDAAVFSVQNETGSSYITSPAIVLRIQDK